MAVTAPNGVTVMGPSLDLARAADPNHTRHEWGPFFPVPLPGHVPIAGEVAYKYGPDPVDVTGGQFATGQTHVSFAGNTAWGDESAIPLPRHQRATGRRAIWCSPGLLTDFGSRTGVVPFGGRGEFDGGMTGAFRRPRVEGFFTGEDMRAWDTLWGDGSAHIVVENSYVTVTDGSIRRGDSEIRAEGLYSLGYPRRDQGEEINARVRVSRPRSRQSPACIRARRLAGRRVCSAASFT